MWPPQPNIKHEHVYAVVRIDGHLLETNCQAVRDAVTITKIVRSMEDAQREVERLNALNAGKDCMYYWELTRLERVPDVESTR